MDKLSKSTAKSPDVPANLGGMEGDRSDRRFKVMGGRRSFDVCDYVREMQAGGQASPSMLDVTAKITAT